MADQGILPPGRQVRSNSRVPANADEAADYAARRAYLLAGVRQQEAVFNRQIEKLEKQRDEATESARNEIERIEERLQAFLRRIHASSGITRLELPNAKLVLNPQGKGVSKVVDAEALLAWAEEHFPKAVKPPALPTVDLEKLRGRYDTPDNAEPGPAIPLITDDGEVIPGIVVEIKQRTFKIEEPK